MTSLTFKFIMNITILILLFWGVVQAYSPTANSSKSPCGHLIVKTEPEETRVDVFEDERISQTVFTKIYKHFKGGSVIITNDQCQISIYGFSHELPPGKAGFEYHPDYGHWNVFSETQSPAFDAAYEKDFHITAISCGCDKKSRDCGTKACSQKNWKWKECAVLYQEHNCQECYYNGISLNHMDVFETKNTAVVRSLIIRPGCKIRRATFGALDFTQNPYDFNYKENMNHLDSTYTIRGENFYCYCWNRSSTIGTGTPIYNNELFPFSSTKVIDKAKEDSSPTTSPDMAKPIEALTESEKGGGGRYDNLKWMGIGIGLLGSVLVLSSIYFCRRRYKRLPHVLTPEEIRQFKEGGAEGCETELATGYSKAFSCSYDSKYEIIREHLIFDPTDPSSIIGEGEYGVVYKGRLNTFDKNRFKDVAIKKVKTADARTLKALLNEIKVHAYLGYDCANIVYFLGACTVNLINGEVFNVTEYCCLGSLQNYLQKEDRALQTVVLDATSDHRNQNGYCVFEENRTPEISSDLQRDLIKWSEQIAVGMNYLSFKKVLHIDLATRNVLLMKNKTAKITDFGLSKKLYEGVGYVALGISSIPYKWIALESLTQYKYSVQSDVWAYGVTIWEIFNLGRQPYESMGWTELLCFLQSGKRLGKPVYSSQNIYEQMLKCWNTDPESRPKFSEMEQFFGHMQNES